MSDEKPMHCVYDRCGCPDLFSSHERRPGGTANVPNVGTFHFSCYFRWVREQLGQKQLH